MIRALQDTFLINLTHGKQAMVDERDWRVLREFKWCAAWEPKTQSHYAMSNERRTEGGWRAIRMHRVILGLRRGDRKMVDHINHNTLDNRRANLLVVTPLGNAENRRDQARHGIGITKIGRRFRAWTRSGGQPRHIGMYDTPAEAQAARAAYLEKHDLME